ncbi:sodium channel protein Nach-like [Megachile rotundata]|uniref:sodium channel protein Nach-like n=1 Tax=Megachile rotundata TaxID=143995 RepID=UPI003FD10E43
MILQLGGLYDSEFITQSQPLRIDQLLSHFYDGYYDITNVMKRLTPQCSSILSRCRFNGQERNCSDIFAFRKTQDGFCCIFNYATKGDDTLLNTEVDHRTDPIKVENLTEEGGLSVLMESFPDDYFYSILPTTGWKVTIFSPYDYPDMISGGVIDVLVSPRTHRSVELEAIMFYSTRSIISYPLDKRDCVFEDEMTFLRPFYTYSDCIVDCRIDDVWKICKCIPFYLPNREGRRVCNIEDIPCLTEHKSKWFSVVPHENVYQDANYDNETIMHCYTCYPECNDISYNARMTESDLVESNRQSAKLLKGVKIEDQGMLTIYFNSFGTMRLRQDVIYRWYELLGEFTELKSNLEIQVHRVFTRIHFQFEEFSIVSLFRVEVIYKVTVRDLSNREMINSPSFGIKMKFLLAGDASGIWGIFVGFSLIAIVEFVYFIGLFVLELVKGPTSSDSNKKQVKHWQSPIQSIYWGELYSNVKPKSPDNRYRGY